MKLFRKHFVRQMVKAIDPTIKVKFGKSLQCDIDNKTIYVAFKTNLIDKITFRDYVRELNSKCRFNTLILGILHEIGHIYTYDEQAEEEWIRDNELLSLLYHKKQIDDIDMNRFYIRIPMESWATEWAIDFAMKNKKFCRYYQNKIGKEEI